MRGAARSLGRAGTVDAIGAAGRTFPTVVEAVDAVR